MDSLAPFLRAMRRGSMPVRREGDLESAILNFLRVNADGVDTDVLVRAFSSGGFAEIFETLGTMARSGTLSFEDHGRRIVLVKQGSEPAER